MNRLTRILILAIAVFVLTIPIASSETTTVVFLKDWIIGRESPGAADTGLRARAGITYTVLDTYYTALKGLQSVYLTLEGKGAWYYCADDFAIVKQGTKVLTNSSSSSSNSTSTPSQKPNQEYNPTNSNGHLPYWTYVDSTTTCYSASREVLGYLHAGDRIEVLALRYFDDVSAWIARIDCGIVCYIYTTNIHDRP